MNPELQNQRLRGAPSQKPLSGPGGKPLTADQLFSANLLALTEIDAGIRDSLADLAESMEVISMYFERKGRAEKLFTDKDFLPADAPEPTEVSDAGESPSTQD